MTRMASPGGLTRQSPWIAGLGQGALAGGLSAYGNLAEENDRNKGDQRMMLESALAALGGGMAAFGAKRAMNANASGIVAAVKQRAMQASPARFAAAKQLYAANPILNRLTPEQWTTLAATGLAAGAGAGLGGANIAPFLSDQMGLIQAPGSWTRRANDWNWDRQIASEQAIAEEIMRRMQAGEVGQ
jgi:hypothetical protein